MGRKFHVNSKGLPAICRAKKGNCPYGGSEGHFDTVEEAQKFADEQHKKKHGVLPGIDNINRKFNYNKDELDALKGRSAKVHYERFSETLNKPVIVRSQGKITDTKFNGDTGIHEITLEAESFVDDKTYTHTYLTSELERINFRDDKFNLSEDEMKDLVDKDVTVSYDGVDFAGTVENIYYKGDRSFSEREGFSMNGLIIKGDNGQYKHIKLNRLTKLTINS